MGIPESDSFYTKNPYVRAKEVSVCLSGDNAVLFNPNTGKEKYLNPTGLFIWKRLNGKMNAHDLAKAMLEQFESPSQEVVLKDTVSFLKELARDKFVEMAPENIESEYVNEYPQCSDRPGEFDISVTGKCNLHCEYCFYAHEMHDRPDLPKEDWFAFFDELGKLAVRNLTLSGGEVFVRKNLWELIDYLIENRMRYSILSNGTLITEKTLQEFEKRKRRLRLNSIQVSIDGSCPDVHDKSRGAGAFARSIHGLRLLKEANFPVTSRVTINRNNVDDLDDIAKLLLDDVGLRSFGTNDAMPMGAGCDNQSTIVLTPKQQLQAIITMHRLEQQYNGRITASAGPLSKWKSYREMESARKTGKRAASWQTGFLTACGCMYNKLAVHHDGVIAPCNMLSELEMGKINRDSIKTIWKTHPTLQALKDRRKIPMQEVPGCKDCEWAPFCNGSCPGLAYTMTGDFNRANPHDCYKKFLEDTELTSESVPWKVD